MKYRELLIRLKTLFLAISLTLIATGSDSQKPDGADTLYTRGKTFILVPTYDTIKQLEKATIKADSLLKDLKEIQCMLNIDTNKKRKK